MADFCLDCAEKIDWDNGMKGITTVEEWAAGKAAVVLCEGCGMIQVDPEGRRVELKIPLLLARDSEDLE